MGSRRRKQVVKPLAATSAKEAVERIFTEFTPTRRFREANEARTRIEVINRMLVSLGWPNMDLEPESPSGTGEFLDYELWAQDQAWMAVEAKRAGVTFDLSDAGTRKSGSHLRSIVSLTSQGGGALREAMKQAATYSNDKGIPLACVTNGFQWLFFRGLSSKHRAWTRGSALVFASADEVIARFDDFLRALGRTWAGTSYVTPGIAGDFEHSIERLLKDAPRGLEDEPHEVVEGSPSKFVSTLSKQVQLSQIKHPVVVVGHVGVGKATFCNGHLHISVMTRVRFALGRPRGAWSWAVLALLVALPRYAAG